MNTALSIFENFANGKGHFPNSWLGFDDFFQRLPLDVTKFPPCNILTRPEEGVEYRVEYALAGYSKDDVEVIVKDNILTVRNKMSQKEESGSDDSNTDEIFSYRHKGIASRNFVSKFAIAYDLEVKEVTMKDGLLSISLSRQEVDPKANIIEIK